MSTPNTPNTPSTPTPQPNPSPEPSPEIPEQPGTEFEKESPHPQNDAPTA